MLPGSVAVVGRGVVARLVVAVDSAVGVDAAELAKAWNGDDEARACGVRRDAGPGAGVFLPPELVEWVAVPMAVNLASSLSMT